MLELIIKGEDVWNEGANSGAGAFETLPPTILAFEHSLLSLSKWEQFYEKPFLGDRPKTQEETFRYILYMCVTPDVPFSAFERMTDEHYKEIQDYIAKKMTATTFHSLTDGRAGRKEVITADLIRYWMISLQIPIEYEARHLSELFTLIKVFDAKNSKQKKKSPTQVMNEQRELNAQRRAALGTTG